MHEMAATESLIRQIKSVMRENQVTEVKSVHVCVGAFSGFMKESLEFCFSVLREGTGLEKTALVIDTEPLELLCEECGETSSPNEVMFVTCAACHSTKVKILRGNSFTITGMEV